MQSKHFIEILTDTYETVYAVHKAGQLTDELEQSILQLGIDAANTAALNSWGDPKRAAAIAVALLQALHPKEAETVVEGLSDAVQLAMVRKTPEPDARAQSTGPVFIMDKPAS